MVGLRSLVGSGRRLPDKFNISSDVCSREE